MGGAGWGDERQETIRIPRKSAREPYLERRAKVQRIKSEKDGR